MQIAITAAKTGDVTTLRRVLEDSPELARESWAHRPLIEFAVREGQLDAVRVLIEAGAPADHMTYYGDTLIDMARDRRYDAIAALLADANAQAPRVSPAEARADHPIHLAAEFGEVERVRSLLDADPALVHRADRSGGTALHRAVIGRSPRVVTLLLDRGADIHAIHGAGLGSSSGYAPEDLQAIDLAIWGGPRVARLHWRSMLDARSRGSSGAGRHIGFHGTLKRRGCFSLVALFMT